jgi:hypothetical protein
MNGAKARWMSIPRRTRLWGVAMQLVTLLLATNGVAQNVPVRRLGKPLWTSADGFSTTPSIRELRDGSLIVVDAKDREVSLLSSSGTKVRVLGRRGAGPGEYRWPIAALPIPGDSTLIVDRELRRLIVLAPNGTPVRTATAPSGAGRTLDFEAIADARGGMVFPSQLVSAGDTVMVPLLRWDRATGRVDTIGRMQLRASVTRTMTRGGRAFRVETRVIYYSPTDALVPAQDGGVIVLRGADYHAELIRPDRTTQAFPPVSYARVPLSAAEKKEEADGDLPVPAYKPPFIEAHASGDGEIWVWRHLAGESPEREWDVLNAQGKRIATLRTPNNQRVLAVTRTRVYVTRVDADGLNWIEAYGR